VEGRRVDRRDDDERDEVVDDDDREHERAQALREAWADQGEQPERERRIGRHDRSPAVRGRAPRVEGKKESDRGRHPAHGREHRQGEATTFAEFAQVEFAPGLEPDDEEKERHQAAVDPLAKVQGDLGAAEANRELRAPKRVVRAGVDVHPRERRDRGRQQDCRAAGLGAQELAKRRL
jgi:hypothetical protein